MDERQQRLLPVFLRDTQGKLPIIDSFLASRKSECCDLAAMDAAFQAISTLKGTANFLDAQSVRILAVRVGEILKKRLLSKTSPTQIEYDVLDLAQQRIRTLINCLKLEQPEPPGLVRGALRAFALAEAFSATSTVQTGRGCTATTEDLFAEDSVFDSEPQLSVESDVFSPAQVVESHIMNPPKEGIYLEIPEDPFADDHCFDLLSAVSGPLSRDTPGKAFGNACFDPFADDPDFEPVAPKLSVD